jgi:phosphatidylglycerol:prolipoprotein diacylglycerol transferase
VLLAWLLAIDININPDIGEIGGLLITWHGVFTAVGIAAGVFLSSRLAKRAGIPDDEIYNIALILLIGGVIGARALYVLENIDSFSDRPVDIFRITEGGISIYGALIGGTISSFLYVKWRKLPVAQIADIAAAGAILGQAVGRIGDIINGEHHAIETDLPWAVRYVHPNTLGEPGLAVHPAVAYEMIGDLLILGFMLWLLPRQPRSGYVFFAWVFLYAALRLGISFLREDEIVFLGLRMAQVVAIIMMAAAVVGVYYLRQVARPLSRAERRRRARIQQGGS